jgi:hypothetical protein
MNKFTLLAVLSCILACSGCAPALMGGVTDIDPKEPKGCSENDCKILVSHEGWLEKCVIHCQPLVTDVIVVDRHYTRGTIEWSLEDSRFKFADDGIEFKNAGFKDCGPGGKGKGWTGPNNLAGPGTKKWQCTNIGEAGAYKYTVHITFGLLSYTIDPWVVNK